MKPMETDADKVRDNTRIWNFPRDEYNEYTVGGWIVRAPWMHLAWSWYVVALYHLRGKGPDNKPAVKQFPEATHEFGVYALHPDHEVDTRRLYRLEPMNLAQQFEATDDAEALGVVETTLDAVLAKRLSLDSDYRKTWHHLLREKCPDVWPDRGG